MTGATAPKKYAPAGGRRAQRPEAGGETAFRAVGRGRIRPIWKWSPRSPRSDVGETTARAALQRAAGQNVARIAPR